MILQFLIILIALVVLYIVFNNKKETLKGKIISVAIFILILSVCSKTMSFERNLMKEGFNVSMPSDNDIENFENKRQEKKSVELNSESYDGSNSYLDNEEETFLNNNNNKKKNNINNSDDLDNMMKGKKVDLNKLKKHNNSESFDDQVQKDISGTSNMFTPSINFNYNKDKELSIKFDANNATTTTTPSTTTGATTTTPAATQGFKNVSNRDSFLNTHQPKDRLKNKEDFNVDGNNKLSFYGDDEGNNEQDPFNWMNEESINTFHQKNKNYRKKENKPFNESFTSDADSKFDTSSNTDNKFVPGMAYMPPKYWAGFVDDEKVALGILNDVNNYRRQSRCPQPEMDINTRRLPIGIMDPGTPIYAFEVGADGKAPKKESDAQLYNIGSILPKFSYTEYNSGVTYTNDKDLTKNNYYHDYKENCNPPYGLGGVDRRDKEPTVDPSTTTTTTSA